MAKLPQHITKNPNARLMNVPIPPHLRLLALATMVSFGLALLPGALGNLFGTMRWIVFAALVVSSGLHLFHLAQRGLLWRLRNKLVLTYLLIGLAPVVLFFLLVFAASYVAAGQFAIHLATARLEEQVRSVAQDNRSVMRHAMDLMPTGEMPGTMRMPEVEERLAVNGPPGLQMAVFRDTTPVEIVGITGHKRTPLGFEHWLSTGPLGSYRAIVLDESLLYLAVTDRVRLPNDHILTVISSVPLNRDRMTAVAANLGRVDLLPGLETQTDFSDGTGTKQTNAPVSRASNAALRQSRISGGTAPPAANFLDLRVRFFSTLPVRDWETGALRGIPLNVESRPSLLYDQLFAAALTSHSTDTIRFAFLAVCLLFAAIEGIALYAGLRLSSTITESVEDLYAATLSIDRGDLEHRIVVERNDQLADLGRSFNRMSQSLGRLIEEQKEKERIESELSIAQEVQANLFPSGNVSLPTLELQGICRPARIVSGDYYDFLPFEHEHRNHDGTQHRTVTGVGIALGDISGKGISAALLMATLHSAVRAYRFASEEMQSPPLSTEGKVAGCGELFESPARILELLNRHLYRSTTPEKYATLFLAHYDLDGARLTYANAGQLPPFVLRADGTVVRLDRGGTVVGLMDNMTYDEESVPLRAGDLLIAYSDGVTEPENDFGDFGEDRLIDVVRAFFHEPLEVISAEVMRALDAWIGDGEQPDDITLVLARQL